MVTFGRGTLPQTMSLGKCTVAFMLFLVGWQGNCRFREARWVWAAHASFTEMYQPIPVPACSGLLMLLVLLRQVPNWFQMYHYFCRFKNYFCEVWEGKGKDFLPLDVQSDMGTDSVLNNLVTKLYFPFRGLIDGWTGRLQIIFAVIPEADCWSSV